MSQQRTVAWCVISAGVGQGMVYNPHTNSNPQPVIWGLGLAIWVEAHLLPFLIREHLAFEPHRSSQHRKLCSQSQYWIIKAEGREAEERLENLGSKWVKMFSTPHTWPSLWRPVTYLPRGEGNPFSIKLQGSLLLQPLSPWIQLPLCSGQWSRGLQGDQTTPVTSEWTYISKLTQLFSPFQQPMFGF